MIRALGAKFITSCPSIKEAPSFVTSEIVFLGRSNVGKSSLINALVNQKNLAKSSSTPGKTQLINFFEAEFCEQKKIKMKKRNLSSFWLICQALAMQKWQSQNMMNGVKI